LVVWWWRDGRPGHEQQALGLLAALGAHRRLEIYEPSLPRHPWLNWVRRRCPEVAGLPFPDLQLGAGHATHLPMLAARRAHGGRVLALMSPSLPLAWFDLCLIPEHDRPPARSNVLVTRGVLNGLPAARPGPARHHMILLGGPSRHYRWSNARTAEEVHHLVRSRQDLPWYVCTSPRTPDGFIAALGSVPAGVEVVEFCNSRRGWVAGELPRADQVWVTEDSVSMVYEALSAGAAVGLLPVSRRRSGRITWGVSRLLADGLVTSYAAWQRGQPLRPPAIPFHEATRCARWLHEQWLDRS
jgi:mitochondrial fission protein ELM1